MKRIEMGVIWNPTPYRNPSTHSRWDPYPPLTHLQPNHLWSHTSCRSLDSELGQRLPHQCRQVALSVCSFCFARASPLFLLPVTFLQDVPHKEGALRGRGADWLAVQEVRGEGSAAGPFLQDGSVSKCLTLTVLFCFFCFFTFLRTEAYCCHSKKKKNLQLKNTKNFMWKFHIFTWYFSRCFVKGSGPPNYVKSFKFFRLISW